VLLVVGRTRWAAIPAQRQARRPAAEEGR
jgi:hypothetical protein